MNKQTQIDKAVAVVAEAKKAVKDIKLPGYKRVSVGSAYKVAVLVNLHNALIDLKLLSEHLK